MTSHMSIHLNTKDGDFSFSIGDKLSTFAIDPHGNKSVMFSTEDLPRIATLVALTLKEWERAKEIETEANKVTS